ncbi:MAG: hypothetical protein L0H93_07955 [Nocardioides sp.]|nr:hypothetical protein [Nocardioides sp.]
MNQTEKTQKYTGRWVIEIPHACEHVDASFPTASWFDVLEIQPGQYPIEWTNIGGDTWNPEPKAVTPGFLANTGPYYARVRLDAILRNNHRSNRLLGEERSVDTYPDEPTTHTLSTYAYLVEHGKPVFTHGTYRHLERSDA